MVEAAPDAVRCAKPICATCTMRECCRYRRWTAHDLEDVRREQSRARASIRPSRCLITPSVRESSCHDVSVVAVVDNVAVVRVARSGFERQLWWELRTIAGGFPSCAPPPHSRPPHTDELSCRRTVGRTRRSSSAQEPRIARLRGTTRVGCQRAWEVPPAVVIMCVAPLVANSA